MCATLYNITLNLRFITHDLTLALGFTFEDGQVPACCTADGTFLPPADLHPFCLPIAIPSDDDYLAQYNQTCMTFVRSLIGTGTGCSLNHAEQVLRLCLINILLVDVKTNDLKYIDFLGEW